MWVRGNALWVRAMSVRYHRGGWETGWEVGRIAALGGIMAIVAVFLSASTYNPFIYFRF